MARKVRRLSQRFHGRELCLPNGTAQTLVADKPRGAICRVSDGSTRTTQISISKSDTSCVLQQHHVQDSQSKRQQPQEQHYSTISPRKRQRSHKKPTCNIVNSQHFPVIDEISSRVILLNGFSGTVEVETEQQLLNGTFLIRFHNVSIRVNGKTYISKEIPTYKVLPSILQLMPEEKERRRLVSLQMLDELQINNIRLKSQSPLSTNTQPGDL
uniref:Uncharacterized protein n=1 Tax=Glossina palpalis gambiensis TaxID=67801 RepID=A0A1B0C432_9MUSC